MGIEAFLPRVCFKRLTRQGPQWTTEALFPSYLFARFDLRHSLRAVQHAPGVSKIVHFGPLWPTIPETELAQLRSLVRDDSVHAIDSTLRAGEEVQLADGPFHGLTAVVTRVMPSRERVKVLLEFLGRQTEAELASSAVIPTANPRRCVAARA
jgi:transcriptional antiterminator RfaH